MKNLPVLVVLLLIMLSCSQSETSDATDLDYFNYEGRSDMLTGGVRLIEITTPSGNFNVWTKRIGNNPNIKVLFLHGGPGATHEYMECFDSYFPAAEIEYYYYDQLGSYYSDQPNDTSLWTTARFVEEVEQVRQSLRLDSTNFYLFGQSWGGILAIEYALKYQENLKGLIISNMMSSVPEYNRYAEEVLGPQLDPQILTELTAIEKERDYTNPRYMEILFNHYYTEHILRMPLEKWPDPLNRAFKHLNHEIYMQMQGPSEFGIKENASLKNWDRSADLSEITVPTLVIGAQHDTMDPEHMEWMASQFSKGRYLYCPNGSHFAQFDDQELYMEGLIKFIKEVDEGTL